MFPKERRFTWIMRSPKCHMTLAGDSVGVLNPASAPFFHWGKMSGVRAFLMGSVPEQSGVVLLTNCNTGLRLTEAVVSEAMPGKHPAMGWLDACVTE